MSSVLQLAENASLLIVFFGFSPTFFYSGVEGRGGGRVMGNSGFFLRELPLIILMFAHFENIDGCE